MCHRNLKCCVHRLLLVPSLSPCRSLEHKHIVRYLGTEVRDNVLYIFTEWVSGGSIERMLQQFSRLPEKVVARYTKQVLIGLMYLHKHKVVHRDIKVCGVDAEPRLRAQGLLAVIGCAVCCAGVQGANILVDDLGTVKLADFGASKRIPGASGGKDRNLTSIDAVRAVMRECNAAAVAVAAVAVAVAVAAVAVPATLCGWRALCSLTAYRLTLWTCLQSMKGTPYFMAPEVISQTGYGPKADVWSVGCTVLQMSTGMPPWKALKFPNLQSLMMHIVECGTGPPIPDYVQVRVISATTMQGRHTRVPCSNARSVVARRSAHSCRARSVISSASASSGTLSCGPRRRSC